MQTTVLSRLRILASGLGVSDRGADSDDLLAAVAEHFVEPRFDTVWLALSVLQAELPTRSSVVATRRSFQTEDARKVLLALPRGPFGLVINARNSVRLMTESTIVDVHHTARTELATGIQRVVRMTIQRWSAGDAAVLVGWTDNMKAMRRLSADEEQNALYGEVPHATRQDAREVAIPWRSRYILPELAIESDRTDRIAAMAEFSGNHTSVIGYDCVPLTSGETTGMGMGAAFARNLVAVSNFDRVATISVAAKVEYQGWRRMLNSAGLSGPDVREVILASEATDTTPEDIALASERLVIDDLPLLLCVGSHEPRKNHLAVLYAAEVLWREGHEFCLTFVGGNAWNSEATVQQIKELKAKGRPVQSVRGIPDAILWGGYRIAQAVVFPSFNEGFGLPVAEAIAAGTPAVTSNFGSMAEIARHGGAVLVDPRDDNDLVDGLRMAMFDPETRQRLAAELAAVPVRTWDTYAAELREYFDAESILHSQPADARLKNLDG